MKDLVRDLTPSKINKSIDESTLATLELYRGSPPEAIEARLKMLEESWDIECFVELGGAALTLAGIGAALAFGSKKLLAIPLAVQGLVLAHSLPLPDPLSPLLRMLGVWTRQEISREMQALKLLRGDFIRVEKDASPKSALAVAQGRKGLKEATGKSTRKTAKPREPKMPLGEDQKPTDVPTVSGESGNPDRVH